MMVSPVFAAQKIIGFDPGTTSSERVRVVEGLGGKVLREFHLIDALVATIPDSIRDADIYSLDGVTTLDDDKYLKWVDVAPVAIPLSSVPHILDSLKTGGFEEFLASPTPVLRKADKDEEIPWGIRRVNAAAAWDLTLGADVKVAILDTGVDFTHPDLQQNYAGGYNAIIPSTSPVDAMDYYGHGTHVAGIVAAVHNNIGVVGVAPKARLYGVKVLDDYGSGEASWIIAGIEWAVDNKIAIINMSLGGPYSVNAFANAVKAAYEKGITIICAAGNTSGPVNYPAKYPEAIAVSALDPEDQIAPFSSRGPEIDFIAPGVSINSTVPGEAYLTKSGTSMASPHVAGLAALTVSLGANTPKKVKDILENAAIKLDLHPTEQGGGLIDAGLLSEINKKQE